MSLVQSIIYGFVSGFAELFPVSGPAHQYIVGYLFGKEPRQPVLDLLVHIATLLAVIIGCFSTIHKLTREQRIQKHTRHRRSRNATAVYDLRIIRTAAIPMLAGLILYACLVGATQNLTGIAIGSLFFGILLLAADHMRQGNKTSQNISALDSLLIGLGCGLSAFPGISRTGMALTVATARGAGKQNAYTWALLLSIPALILFICLDFAAIFTIGAGALSMGILAANLVAAIAAFGGGYCAITFVNYLSVRSGFSNIAYYNLGVAAFSFILYLIT